MHYIYTSCPITTALTRSLKISRRYALRFISMGPISARALASTITYLCIFTVSEIKVRILVTIILTG